MLGVCLVILSVLLYAFYPPKPKKIAPLALRSVVEAEDELQTTDEEGDEEDDLLEGLKEEREKDDALKQHDRNKNEVNR